MQFAELTKNQIEFEKDRGSCIILPIGALEQHSNHLPVGTDYFIANKICLECSKASKNISFLVLPPISFGFSPHHIAHQGTITLRIKTIKNLLKDIIKSVSEKGFTKIIIVNGHGGNSTILKSFANDFVANHNLAVTALDYWGPSKKKWEKILKGKFKSIGHACEFETSLSMFLRGKKYTKELIPKINNLPPRLTQPFIYQDEPDIYSAANASMSPIFISSDCGYYGDPAASEYKTGERLFHVIVKELKEFLSKFAKISVVTNFGLK